MRESRRYPRDTQQAPWPAGLPIMVANGPKKPRQQPATS